MVSGDTKAAAEGVLPAGLGWRPLGRHRLAGLGRPTALYQLEAAELLADFPPLRTEARADGA